MNSRITDSVQTARNRTSSVTSSQKLTSVREIFRGVGMAIIARSMVAFSAAGRNRLAQSEHAYGQERRWHVHAVFLQATSTRPLLYNCSETVPSTRRRPAVPLTMVGRESARLAVAHRAWSARLVVSADGDFE